MFYDYLKTVENRHIYQVSIKKVLLLLYIYAMPKVSTMSTKLQMSQEGRQINNYGCVLVQISAQHQDERHHHQPGRRQQGSLFLSDCGFRH